MAELGEFSHIQGETKDLNERQQLGGLFWLSNDCNVSVTRRLIHPQWKQDTLPAISLKYENRITDAKPVDQKVFRNSNCTSLPVGSR